MPWGSLWDHYAVFSVPAPMTRDQGDNSRPQKGDNKWMDLIFVDEMSEIIKWNKRMCKMRRNSVSPSCETLLATTKSDWPEFAFTIIPLGDLQQQQQVWNMFELSVQINLIEKIKSCIALGLLLVVKRTFAPDYDSPLESTLYFIQRTTWNSNDNFIVVCGNWRCKVPAIS